MGWRDIFEHLIDGGFETHSIGQHKGVCESPYLVLRSNGVVRKRSIEAPEYEILLYYPMNHYSEFEGYIADVKSTMNELYPRVKLVDDEHPHYQDDDKKAYTTSLIYRNTRVSKVNRI